MNSKTKKYLETGLFALIAAVVITSLHHLLGEYHYQEITAQLRRIPLQSLLWAVLLTVLGYAILPSYDALALRYLNRHLSAAKITFAAFVSYALGNTLGFSWLTGGSVRYRLYSAWGLTAIEITRLVAFCTAAFWIGFFTLGNIAVLLDPMTLPPVLGLKTGSLRLAAGLGLALTGFLAVAAALRRKPVRLLRWEFQLPPLNLFLAQMGIAALDWTLAGLVLFVLLPSGTVISFPQFLAVYLFSQMVGVISHVPGGLGVFETLMVFFLSSRLPASQILGCLMAYRVVYYLLPFGLALGLFGTYEALQNSAKYRRTLDWMGKGLAGVAPNFFSVATFMGGLVLLVSGNVPALPHRIQALNQFLPIPVLEFSHFLASLAGVALLILARGIQLRLDAAYYATTVLLAAGVVFSLLKGLDWEEAALLAGLLIMLLPARRQFYRKSSVLAEPFSPGWMAAILLALFSTTWLGFFAYKHVDYSHDLWWMFSLESDASRFLRATVGVGAGVMFYSLARLLRPAKPLPALPSADELDRAFVLVGGSERTNAYLALLGDKQIIYSENTKGFLMYGVAGHSWVCMGDPVGDSRTVMELAWEFRELCDKHAGRPVFYEVGTDRLSLYLDLGLTPLKIGEEARVPLGDFSLEGPAHAGFRYTVRRMEKEGWKFEIVPSGEVPRLLPRFREISDEWLSEKKTREKGFSLGSFKEHYLRRFPAAMVSRDGRPEAFANLWLGGGKQELSVDLMRHSKASSSYMMDFLFIRLMLWGREQGYRWFNLGMAPLSGLENRKLAPVWHRLGSLIARHGERFYNFQGLRQYKEKFHPVWESRYLLYPGGFSLPVVLANVAGLISKGVKGVVAK